LLCSTRREGTGGARGASTTRGKSVSARAISVRGVRQRRLPDVRRTRLRPLDEQVIRAKLPGVLMTGIECQVCASASPPVGARTTVACSRLHCATVALCTWRVVDRCGAQQPQGWWRGAVLALDAMTTTTNARRLAPTNRERPGRSHFFRRRAYGLSSAPGFIPAISLEKPRPRGGPHDQLRPS
jgi:hypothetical protein